MGDGIFLVSDRNEKLKMLLIAMSEVVPEMSSAETNQDKDEEDTHYTFVCLKELSIVSPF